MKRLILLFTSFCGLSLAAEKPNILIILADDMASFTNPIS